MVRRTSQRFNPIDRLSVAIFPRAGIGRRTLMAETARPVDPGERPPAAPSPSGRPGVDDPPKVASTSSPEFPDGPTRPGRLPHQLGPEFYRIPSHHRRVRRSQAGLTKTALAGALGYTPQWISQVEAAKSIPSRDFAENLDTFFKTNGLFHRLWKRIIDTLHQAILPPGFPEYQDREAEASQVRTFELTLVHGLLQTENYIRAVVGHNQDPDTAECLVAERLERQNVLTREDPPNVWFTLDESTLRREVAERDVMGEQLAHILSMGGRPNISIDIVPLTAKYYPGLTGSFTILSFTNSPDLVYGEIAGQGMLIQEPQIVSKFAVRYNSLRGDALRVEESRTLITKVMEEYG